MTDPILAAEVAEAAARAGGAALMARRLERLDVEYKDARANLVTVADRESQSAIADTILTAFPGHAVDGEEGVAGNFDSPDVWYVDPLDGTTNFTHGLPFSCVSVALRSSARPGHFEHRALQEHRAAARRWPGRSTTRCAMRCSSRRAAAARR